MATSPQPQIAGNPYSVSSVSNGYLSGITNIPSGIVGINQPGSVTIRSAVEDVLRISFADIDPVFTLIGEENNQAIELQLNAERNISAYEQHLISTFIMGLMTRSTGVTRTKVMTYVRKHNLERHFKFTVK
jgi:hypothetical protein